MKINLIFLIILGFMVLRTICNNNKKTKEHMTLATDILNISDVATKLQAGNLTVDGALTINGATTVRGRNLLTELDTLKETTINIVPHLTRAGNNAITVFASKIYCYGLWTDSGNISVAGDGDIYVDNVSGIRDLHARVLALEAKCNALEAKTKFLSINDSANESIFNCNVRLALSKALILTNYTNPNYYNTILTCVNGDLINNNGTIFNMTSDIASLNNKTRLLSNYNDQWTVFQGSILVGSNIQTAGEIQMVGDVHGADSTNGSCYLKRDSNNSHLTVWYAHKNQPESQLELKGNSPYPDFGGSYDYKARCDKLNTKTQNININLTNETQTVFNGDVKTIVNTTTSTLT